MTGDQALINKIEKVEAALGSDQVLAAYHLLDELIREVETAARESLRVEPPSVGPSASRRAPNSSLGSASLLEEPSGQRAERFPALAVG